MRFLAAKLSLYKIELLFFLSSFLVACCMSQKTEKPTLSGQRIKTRKRGNSFSLLTSSHFIYQWLNCVIDEKEKYDPVGFRDSVLAGIAEAGEDLESIYKFLDSAGSKLDYRRYGEALFDILIAGGLLGIIDFIF